MKTHASVDCSRHNQTLEVIHRSFHLIPLDSITSHCKIFVQVLIHLYMLIYTAIALKKSQGLCLVLFCLFSFHFLFKSFFFWFFISKMSCFICAKTHATADCSTPATLSRCENCYIALFGPEPHNCEADRNTVYRRNITAKRLLPAFKMRMNRSNVSLNVLDTEQGTFVPLVDTILSPATRGAFLVVDNGENRIISYRMSGKCRFSFYIAVIKSNEEPVLSLRAWYTDNKLHFFKVNLKLKREHGKISIPSEYRYNTALILALELHKPNVTIEVLNQDAITYSTENGWQCEEAVSMERQQQLGNAVNNAMCYNCNGNHESDECNWPEFMHCCDQCLVTSLDGHFHTNPCRPINRPSIFRPNIFAKQQTKLFQIVFMKDDVSLAVLNEQGQFNVVGKPVYHLSIAADCLIEIEIQNQIIALNYSVSTFARASFLIAVLVGNLWRLRFRAVVTPVHGLLIFKQESTLRPENGQHVIPAKFADNTIGIIGIIPKGRKFTGMVDVYTQPSYKGTFGWKKENNAFDEYGVSVDLDGYKKKSNMRVFGDHLKRGRVQPLSTFVQQSVAVPLAPV